MDIERGGRQWRGEMDDMVATCSKAQAADEVMLVCQLIGLITQTGASGQIMATHLDFDRQTRWAQMGASLSAVTTLLGNQVGYMLSRSPAGGAMATLVIEGWHEEFSCFGETEAIALSGAVCAALAAMLDVPPADTGTRLH